LHRWFNTDVFERGSKLQLASNIRTFPSRISAVRDDGINVLDFSLFKNITVREGMTVQIRGEAENIANHPCFDPPNRTPKSSNFGRVTGTQEDGGARRVFVGVKFIF